MKKSTGVNLTKFYLWVGIAYFLLQVISTWPSYQSFVPTVFNNLWGVIYLTAVNYLLFEHTVPFALRKRRSIIFNILLSVLFLFIYLMFYSYGAYAWRLLGQMLHVYTTLKAFVSMGMALQNQMRYSAGSVFLFAIARHIYNYIKLKEAAQQLRIEKQGAELNYLRSQTNPHFLFNTLNNIYALARDKDDLAPESILRLSKILRFMLYETSGAYISIEQELRIIDDYLALEKLRYDETLRIDFSHNIEDMKQSMSPLLLIPLVENAFKHGVSETRDEPFVHIHLSIQSRKLIFVVKNSSEQSSINVKENIGLSNLRRQLELLYTDYDLTVQQAGAVFIAKLTINLASHV